MASPSMQRRLASVLLAGFVLATFSAGAADPAYVPVEQRLSAAQMQATGLDRLSAEQLALLNQLLREERAAVVADSKAAAREEKQREKAAPVASQLEGEFRGWSAGTVFGLANGQHWRVVEGSFHATRSLAAPRVTVRPGAFGSWYLAVEGVPVQAKVKRVD